MMLFLYLIGATLLYLALKYLVVLITLLFSKSGNDRFIHRFWPLLEAFVWLQFIALIAADTGRRAIFDSNLSIIAITIMLLLFSWYFLRDYIAGITLRVESGFKSGLQIKIGELEGTISKVRYRSLTVISLKGEITTIPYSKIESYTIILPDYTLEKKEHEVVINFNCSLEPSQLKWLITKRVLEFPWIINDKEFNIELTSSVEGEYLLKLTLYLSSPDIALKSESAIRHYIEERFSHLPI